MNTNHSLRVFIGSHKKFERCEPVIAHSIKKHCSGPIEINILRPEYYGFEDSGCTGFSKMRWNVPQICGHEGYAIYLDVDMILMADIYELMRYKVPGSHSCVTDGSTEVMVMDCSINIKSLSPKIPKVWNFEDYSAEESALSSAKLIHFTDLKTQPWFYEHPKPWLSKIWFDLEHESTSID